ncbi:uncharacterized protein LOC115996011 [Ipomoea triloba]|uniref:uncharacterized protein LOC115996011 n=1 Tax=Ipomoea triloba TaxID=35885 RepID=UPI00125D8AA1|nr:uncharacterized protein LOC115996011 [Ipomoea triloba]
MGVRDILVECKSGKLKRINELNSAYLPLQYPILFPYGEDGYRDDIQFNTTITQAGGSRQRITSREYFAYQIHERRSTLSTLLHAKRLFQQFLIDGYTMVESGRLLFIRNNQKALRCEVYKGLSDALFRRDIDPATQGKRIILPSSFTSGARYMIQNYQDAMAICRWIGYPNLFITFTCNPKWPEIQRYMGIRGLRAEDRPDIVARVFKMKLDALIKDFKVGKLFGPVKALIYTIEFQKRGLPHAHIVIFLGSNAIVSSPELMDSLISAEIHDKENDPEYHQAVEDFMIHGPCGVARKNSPCMVNGKCSKHFPKKFVFVVEIQSTYECGVVQPIKIYKILIQSRSPAVERLSFHLPDSHTVFFQDDEDVESVLTNPTLGQSMFTEWCLLNIVKGPTCYARGLLEDDNEYIDAIEEASQWSSAYSLRKLFVTLLMPNTMVSTESVWNKVWLHLTDDAQHNCRRLLNQSDLFLNDEEKKEFALLQLSKLLLVYNKTLRDFPNMPVINEASTVAVENRFLWEELAYDRAALCEESERLQSQLTEERRRIYDAVISDIYSNNGDLFFVYGYGSTGKTFLWRELSALIRAKGHIVINVASSGIASLLLPGGRTAHSSDSKTFGGKTVVLGGDFRQILPVVPKGSRQDIVSAAINSSYPWTHCRVMRLTKNLRLNSMEPGVQQEQLEEFANWLTSIGDGNIGVDNDGYAEFDIPSKLLLHFNGDPISTIVQSTFPNFTGANIDGSCFKNSAILAPTLEVVNEVNQYMSNLTQGEGKTYLSSNTTCKADGSNSVLSDVHTPEFLSTIRAFGLPNHSLTLKVGSPVMLMRNIDHTLGLCNGTRLVVTKLGNHVVEGSILAGLNARTKVLIARMTITIRPKITFQVQ